MKDLFLKDTPETDKNFEKVSELGSMFLPTDSTQWIKKITTNFLEQFPYLQNETISVSWNKKDEDKGYAVGRLNVLGGAVPLVIKEFKLAPMDVFIINGETMPLNNYFLGKVFNKPEAFKQLESGKRRPGYVSLFGSNNALQFSPTQDYGGNNGRMTRDAVKVASVIDKLSFIQNEDAVSTISHLKDPEIRRSFEKKGHMDLFVKIAQKAQDSGQYKAMEDYFRDLDIDRQMVYTDDYGNAFAKQANSTVDKTWTVELDSVERSELDPVIANTKVAYRKETEKTASTPTLTAKDLKKGESGAVAIRSLKKVAFEDFEITKIAKVEPNPEVFVISRHLDTKNGAIAIEKTGGYAFRDKIAKSTIDFDELEGKEPQVGDFGVFVTKTASTEPFEVTNTVKMPGPGRYEVSGEEGFQKVSYYPINVESEEFEAHEKLKHAHYVPKNAKFVKLSGKNENMKALQDFEAKIKVEGLNGFDKCAFYLTDTEDSRFIEEENAYLINQSDLAFATPEMQKEASFSIFNGNHTITRDEAGLYNLSGNEFAKYAQNNPIRNLDELDAKWAALHCGATEKDLEKISSMKKKDAYTLEGEIKAPSSIKSVERALKTKYANMNDKKLSFAKDLVKVAAQFRDKTSVDAILSLNMLRKRNIKEYLEMLPTLQYVLGKLAKLLIASRMGLDETDPDSIKAAVEGMSEVVMQLEKLQAAAKEVK